VPDEIIKEYLLELVCGDGFPYGYGLLVNHKKVCRLCKELDILWPQRKIYPILPFIWVWVPPLKMQLGFWQMLLKVVVWITTTAGVGTAPLRIWHPWSSMKLFCTSRFQRYSWLLAYQRTVKSLAFL